MASRSGIVARKPTPRFAGSLRLSPSELPQEVIERDASTCFVITHDREKTDLEKGLFAFLLLYVAPDEASADPDRCVRPSDLGVTMKGDPLGYKLSTDTRSNHYWEVLDHEEFKARPRRQNSFIRGKAPDERDPSNWFFVPLGEVHRLAFWSFDRNSVSGIDEERDYVVFQGCSNRLPLRDSASLIKSASKQ